MRTSIAGKPLQGPAIRVTILRLPAEVEGLTTNRRRYFVEGVSCRVGSEALPVVNLSAKGLYASSPHPPSPGEDLELELLLQPEAPLKMHGRVRWINDGASTSDGRLPIGYGVELTDLDAPARNAILEFLKHSDPVRSRPWASADPRASTRGPRTAARSRPAWPGPRRGGSRCWSWAEAATS